MPTDKLKKATKHAMHGYICVLCGADLLRDVDTYLGKGHVRFGKNEAVPACAACVKIRSDQRVYSLTYQPEVVQAINFVRMEARDEIDKLRQIFRPEPVALVELTH
ncbi:MAG: hypothetical protein U0836_17905 [Pirellulales bacterium]